MLKHRRRGTAEIKKIWRRNMWVELRKRRKKKMRMRTRTETRGKVGRKTRRKVTEQTEAEEKDMYYI